jgi:protein-tyrosine phosphatase
MAGGGGSLPVTATERRPNMSIIELAGAYNVRDVGGLATADDGQTRHALLYRGDSLDAITDNDQDLLFRQLNIGTVVDVRARKEIAYAKWRDTAVRYYQLAVISDENVGTSPLPVSDPAELAKVYLADLQNGAPVLREILAVLANHLEAGIPCIVHCAAGRDRTGGIMAVLLAAIGVRDEEIVRDYVLSNHHARHVERRLAENPLYANGQITGHGPVLASADTLTGFLALLRRGYGSPAQFLLASGLAAGVLRRLEAALVQRHAPPAG